MAARKKAVVEENLIPELIYILAKESSNNEDAGILHLAKGHFTGDLHQRKIARAIQILKTFE